MFEISQALRCGCRRSALTLGLEKQVRNSTSLGFALGFIRVFRQITEKLKEGLRLADEESVRRESFDAPMAAPLVAVGRMIETAGNFLAEKHSRFGHDQVRLEVLSAERRGI